MQKGDASDIVARIPIVAAFIYNLKYRGDKQVDIDPLLDMAEVEWDHERYFREKGRVRLQPENSALEPIYAKHVQILGKVVGVFREL